MQAWGPHLLGYVSEIDAETSTDTDPRGTRVSHATTNNGDNPLDYESGDTLGATGVEHAWESYLRGQRGLGRNAWSTRRGRYRTGPEAEELIDAPSRLEPIPGRDLRLSVDVELEQAIEKAMRPHAAGAVVAVDVRNGATARLSTRSPTSTRTTCPADPDANRRAGRRSRISMPTLSVPCSTRR